jgi:hypothetical protein
LTGRLPEAPSSRRRRRNRHHEDEGPATIANGITKAFMGVGFILVSFAAFLFAPAGRLWWFWLLIPAFAMLGKGVAEIVSARYAPNPSQRATQSAVPPIARPGELPLHNDVRFPPPSVTEQTTRQLDPKTDSYRRRDTDAHWVSRSAATIMAVASNNKSTTKGCNGIGLVGSAIVVIATY